MPSRLALAALLPLIAGSLLLPLDAAAVRGAKKRKKKEKEKPALTLKVRKAGKVIGTEVLRVREGEANRYLSTRSRLRDRGRRYVFRTHTVLDDKGAMVTYDRWIDVKGATLRRRVFAFKGAWKHVVFGQPGQKNKLTELEHKGTLLVLDPRSPILVSLAVDRLVGKGPTAWVDANAAEKGTLTMRAEHLVDAKGGKYIRYHLEGDRKGKPVAMSVLRNDKGVTLEVTGLGGHSGTTKGFSSAELTPDPAHATAGAAGAKGDDTPIAPPGAAPAKPVEPPKPADPAKPAAPAKPAPKPAESK